MGLYKVVLETTDERGSRATPEMDRYGKSFFGRIEQGSSPCSNEGNAGF